MKRLIRLLFGKLGYVIHHKTQWEAVEKRIRELEATEASREQELLKRTNLMAAKLQRQRDEVASQLAACHEQLARADRSGRIAALESEIGRLRTRLQDLEAYLKKTRGEGARYFL